MSRRRTLGPGGGLALGLLILGCAAGGAEAAVVDFALGWEDFEGEFEGELEGELEGPDEITLSNIPLEVMINRPGGQLTLVIPYTSIDRTGTVTMTMDGPTVIGAGGPGAPPYQTSRPGGSESGLGDIILREESYLLRGGKGKRPFLSWILDFKIPTADDTKGLGTGKRDWGLGLEYTQPLGKVFQLLGDASYRFMGSRDGLDTDDRVRLLAGFALVGGKSTWRVTFENVTPAVDRIPVFDKAGALTGNDREADDYRIARLDLTLRSGRGGTTRLTLTKGFTDAAEDLGIAIRLSTGN
jgi:hypothetical protein